MDHVNRTLYIPLYGKSFVSKNGILLHDPKAEEIWDNEGFLLKGKAKSKWLAYYMGIRSVVFDRWTEQQMDEWKDAVILHLGCGMDSRCLRVDAREHFWFDVDFPAVITERKRYFQESGSYRMIAGDVREADWISELPQTEKAIVVMEGISMYLRPEALKVLLERIAEKYSQVRILMDSYTTFAAKATKYKNPINEVGVTVVYGMDDPRDAILGTMLRYVKEHELTPEDLIMKLPRKDQFIFRHVFAGSMSKKLYRLYEYERVSKTEFTKHSN